MAFKLFKKKKKLSIEEERTALTSELAELKKQQELQKQRREISQARSEIKRERFKMSPVGQTFSGAKAIVSQTARGASGLKQKYARYTAQPARKRPQPARKRQIGSGDFGGGGFQFGEPLKEFSGGFNVGNPLAEFSPKKGRRKRQRGGFGFF